MPVRLVAKGLRFDEFEILKELGKDRRAPPPRTEEPQSSSPRDPIIDGLRDLAHWLQTTIPGRACVLSMRYWAVVMVGAAFMHWNPAENLSWIDAVYFAVVTSTSVGYGDITPTSDGAKLFLIPYMLLSTLIVAHILASYIDLYVSDYVGGRIMDTLLKSVTYVHKADIDDNNLITEADYVLFKLHQMQLVDKDLEAEISKRFLELDKDLNGYIDVGVEIPSAAQVKELESELAPDKEWEFMDLFKAKRDKPRELMDLWKARRAGIAAKTPGRRGSLIEQERMSIGKCHEYTWSPLLWEEAKDDILKTSAVLLALYMITVAVVYGTSHHARDEYTPLRGMYLVAQSVTTVGLGDVSPSSPLTRCAAIFLIPAGMVIVSFGISYVIAASFTEVTSIAAKLTDTAVNSVDSVVSPVAKKIRVQAEDAPPLHEQLTTWLKTTITGRITAVVTQFAGILLLGGLVFMATEDWVNTSTAVDAFYFSSVVATTVGYGHEIWPVSATGRAFMTFYFFVSTLVVGALMAEATDIYVNGIIGARIKEQILDTTIFVHRADFDLDGRVTEADYILFKLMQLRQIDSDVLARIVGRFHDLDWNKSGILEIGVEVPSAQQVAAMQKQLGITHTTTHDNLSLNNQRLCDLWEDARPRLAEGRVKRRIAAEDSGANDSKLKNVLLLECHDFAWSSHLWGEAARGILVNAGVALAVYVVLFKFLITDVEGMGAVDAIYFITATLTSVGYGDLAPTKQLNRGAAIFLIPAGLVILGMLISYAAALINGQASEDISVDPRSGSVVSEAAGASDNLALERGVQTGPSAISSPMSAADFAAAAVSREPAKEEEEEEEEAGMFVSLDSIGRARHLTALAVDRKAAAPYSSHAACLAALPSAADCAAVLARLPTSAVAAVLVELRLRGDYRDVLGAMGKGGGAAVGLSLEGDATLAKLAKGMPSDAARRLVGCGSAAACAGFLASLPTAPAAAVVAELLVRGAAGPVLTAAAPAACAALLAQNPGTAPSLLAAMEAGARAAVLQRMPVAERDATLTAMPTAAAAETRAALGLGAAKARKGEDAGLLAELAALMAKGGSMTPAEAARSKELMVLLKGPKAQGVSN